MKLLIDMNLSPDWREILVTHGWEAVHWSSVGKPTAQIKRFCNTQGTTILLFLTHDLDFSAILAATRANAPSVIQVQTQVCFSNGFKTCSSRHCANSNLY